MSSLACQSFMSGYCFAVSQSLMDLWSLTKEKIFVVSTHGVVTSGDSSFTGGSRKRFTRRSSFHYCPQRDGSRSVTDLKWRSVTIPLRLLKAAAPLVSGSSTTSVLRSPPPYAAPSDLQLRFRSERTYMRCSGSGLTLVKSQSFDGMGISSHRSPSSSRCKWGSVSLLGGCLTPMLPLTTIFSLPPFTTVKLNPGEPWVADIIPTFSSTWARSKLFLKGVSPFFISLNITFTERTKPISCFEALVLVNSLSMTFGGFTEALIRTSLHTMLYLSCLKSISSLWSLVGSLAPPSKTFLRSVTSPAIKQMNLPKSLTVLLSCGAARTGSEDATEFVSTIFRGVDWLSTSRLNVTKFRPSGFAVNSILTHSSCSLNSLSIYLRGFSISIICVVVSLCTVFRARIDSLSKCNPND